MQLHKAKIRYPDQSNESSDKKANRVSLYSENFKGEYYNISVDKLIPFSKQARTIFDEESIKKLADTIKEHGIRQPLTVLPAIDKGGVYEIISGERRFRAAKLLNMETVPCIIIHDRQKAEEIALIENIQRKNLHPVELMNAFQNLLDSKVFESISQLADKLGMQKSSVVEILNLKNLPAEIQDTLLSKKIKSRSLYRSLLKSSPDLHAELIESYINGQQENASSSKSSKNIASKLRSKSNVVIITLEDGKLNVTHNKVAYLSPERKTELISLINDLVTE